MTFFSCGPARAGIGPASGGVDPACLLYCQACLCVHDCWAPEGMSIGDKALFCFNKVNCYWVYFYLVSLEKRGISFIGAIKPVLLCVQVESCIPPPGNGKANVSSPFVCGNNLLLSLNSVAADCFPPASPCSVWLSHRCSPSLGGPSLGGTPGHSPCAFGL